MKEFTVSCKSQKSILGSSKLFWWTPMKGKTYWLGCRLLWTAGWNNPSPKHWLVVAWHFTGYFYILFPVNVVTILEQAILQAERCPEDLMPFMWTKAGSFIKEYSSEAFKIGVGHVRKRHHKNYWKSIIVKYNNRILKVCQTCPLFCQKELRQNCVFFFSPFLLFPG